MTLTGLPDWYVFGENTGQALGLDERTGRRWRRSA
jgi:hypothetical protein